MNDSLDHGGIASVIFDFSGTLFRLEQRENWTPPGVSAKDAERLMQWLTAPIEPPVPLDPEHLHAWKHRDLDPALHRAVYDEILNRWKTLNGVDVRSTFDILTDPLRWTPYPDTGVVLEKLSTSGIRIAVLSNIAFDIRPAFETRGWDRWIDEFVLSYEVGAAKPDPTIFLEAVKRLDGRPDRTLMVGDSPQADSAATHIGCTVALVTPSPTAIRHDALLQALREYSLPV
ncbi:HAD-IA family hydrolase [Rhodococcus erythropolis]|uniref:HAD family hydrolase n=1 Tax=Rhodococcus erythropolis TaxID=1833 RepID=UPI0012921376|nr:HAD-IA family hydrolase [Rhodococcus erythropolis]MQP33479.1 HAD-IA family hydrolase [Rhodococcus erythropolis]